MSIKVDTRQLNNYANRLGAANNRLSDLDTRINTLYKQVGLLGLLNLIRADIKIGRNRQIDNASAYLRETANEFVRAEREINNSYVNDRNGFRFVGGSNAGAGVGVASGGSFSYGGRGRGGGGSGGGGPRGAGKPIEKSQSQWGTIGKAAEETHGLVHDLVQGIIMYITEVLYSALPPWLASLAKALGLIEKIITAMKIASLVGGVVNAAAVGACLGKAIGDAVAGAAHLAAKKVFGAKGSKIAAAAGKATGPAAIVFVPLGYVAGGIAGNFMADWIFLDKASALFGAIKMDGLGFSNVISNNVAGIYTKVAGSASTSVNAPATGVATGKAAA
ncbi:MAG: hypothetical protein FWE83_06470 [Oscillospiraceae bacterium]|nr:hypothetical protein [Oscillospiraceae bacterium]